jgi:hypothetical protein
MRKVIFSGLAFAVAMAIAPAHAVEYTIPVKVMGSKPGKFFRFVSKGSFFLPDALTSNPTTEGGSLSFSGTTGGATYSLPSAGWKGLGPGGDGSQGFKFKGDICKSIIIRQRVIKGVCRPDTGDFGPLPEPGPLNVRLEVGDQDVYCAQCGGTSKGNPSKIFRRKDCTAPISCPASPSGAFLDASSVF